MGCDTDADFEDGTLEQEIKSKVLDNVDYKSDSALYKDNINALNNLSVKIGQMEFPKTEMVALTQSLNSLEEVYRDKLGLPPPEPLPGVSEEVLREHSNNSLPVSHSMIFPDEVGFRPGTTGLDALNKDKDRYFGIIKGRDERRLISEAPIMLNLLEIPRMIADGDYSSNDSKTINSYLDTLEKNIQTMIPVFQDLTKQIEAMRSEGIPITGDVNIES